MPFALLYFSILSYTFPLHLFSLSFTLPIHHHLTTLPNPCHLNSFSVPSFTLPPCLSPPYPRLPDLEIWSLSSLSSLRVPHLTPEFDLPLSLSSPPPSPSVSVPHSLYPVLLLRTSSSSLLHPTNTTTRPPQTLPFIGHKDASENPDNTAKVGSPLYIKFPC